MTAGDTKVRQSGAWVAGSFRFQRSGVWEPAFSPMSIAWTEAWWASGDTFAALAVADGAAVTSLPPEAGALTLAQGTAAQQPVYRAAAATMNNRPAIQFDGADALFSAGATAHPQPYTQVVVGRTTTTASTKTYAPVGGGASDHGVGMVGTGGWRLGYGTAVDSGTANTGAHILFGYGSGASSTMKVDGTTAVTGNAGTSAFATTRVLGAANSAGLRGLNGFVAFYAVVARALTTQEETDLVAWSQSVYGTP